MRGKKEKKKKKWAEECSFLGLGAANDTRGFASLLTRLYLGGLLIAKSIFHAV